MTFKRGSSGSGNFILCDMHSLMPVGFSHVVIYEWLFTRIFFVVVAVVVIKCFMIGVNVWWVYLAPQNIPRAISVLTLGNKVILYCIVILFWSHCKWHFWSQRKEVSFTMWRRTVSVLWWSGRQTGKDEGGYYLTGGCWAAEGKFSQEAWKWTEG